jgi:hypothetical protein
MKRIATGVLITRSPGATVHIAAERAGTVGVTTKCRRPLYHPSADPAHLTGPRCVVCSPPKPKA